MTNSNGKEIRYPLFVEFIDTITKEAHSETFSADGLARALAYKEIKILRIDPAEEVLETLNLEEYYYGDNEWNPMV